MTVSTASGPPRLERRALRDSVYDLVLNMLLDGTFQPDDNLSIDGLARDLGVSPTPIREALVHLEHTGLVTRTALRGYRVAPPFSPEQIGQLVDARAILELGALEHALERRASLAPTLQEAHDQHRRVIDELEARPEEALVGDTRVASYRRYFDADWGFHLVIMRHADNPFIIQMAESLGAHVHRLRQSVGLGSTDWEDASAEHARIVEAINSGAPAKVVKQAMRDHLEAVRERSIADSQLITGTGEGPLAHEL
ncbi:MAG: GntR family transcriptional regulator [Microlunatus sp.]